MNNLEQNEKFISARNYIQKGWHVFPCHFVTTKGTCSCKNDNCNSVGKHPILEKGLNDSSIDLNQIKKWWQIYPHANIGIRTGEISGIDAIDIDPRHGGDDTWSQLVSQFGTIENTPMATTGGGGTHIIIKHNKNFHSQNNILEGIDIKADGGYILAEPSNHISGRTYEWELIYHPDEIEPIDLEIHNPDFFSHLTHLQNKPQGEKANNFETSEVYEGNRNGHLTSVAGGLRRRGMNSDQIAHILNDYNLTFCIPPLEKEEVDRIAFGMMRYEPEPEAPSTIDPEIGVQEINRDIPSVLPLTDAGNRDRLVYRYGSQILYVPEQGWRLWDGIRWDIDNTARITEMALDTARTIRIEEQTGVVDKNGVDKAEKWSYASESLTKIKAMIQLAQSHPEVACSVTKLDQHKYLFNASNATINVLTGESVDPDPIHNLTQASNMPFDPEKDCPKWRIFLNEILPDPEVVKHLQKYLGISLTGDMTAEAMFILYGEGANGKSILLEILADLMGDYLNNAPAHTFLNSSRNEAIRNDLAMLRSSRLVTVSETNKGSLLDESVIKRTVSGDQETARFLHKEFFSFSPQYKILLATNNKPEINGGTHGTWRRLHLIEFAVKFGSDGYPKARRKDEIIKDLKSEASGILNWLLEGYKLYQKEGLIQPTAVNEATRHYREDQDPLVEFITSCCTINPDLTVTTSDLREAFNSYTGQDQSAVWFGRAMSEKGYRASRQGSARTRIYKGLCLNTENASLLNRNNMGQFE